MAIVILVKTEDEHVSELPILGKVSIGRSKESDYQILDNKISSAHGTFEISNSGQLIFTDLGSSNGSYLNNSQIHKSVIKINDILRIGNTLIKINDKKLNSTERLAVGVAKISNKEALLPPLTQTQIEKEAEIASKNSDDKKSVVLQDIHKIKKKAVANWSEAENFIEQEASSGKTKFLKLEKKKK